MSEHSHSHHAHHSPAHDSTSHWLRTIAIGSALATGAVIVAPYVLPAVGIGSAALAQEAMMAMHGAGLGNGLAGSLNVLVSTLPFGESLAAGGFATAAATALVGIGGVLLGRYVENRDDGTRHIRWGKIIQAAAIGTSALIALPSLLTGISSGIVFLCAALVGPALAASAVALLVNTLGSTGTASLAASGVTGAALTLPHLLSCGATLVPLSASVALSGSARREAEDAIVASVEQTAPLEKGKPCRARLVLKRAGSGLPVLPHELATVHTEKIHLLLADANLKDYHHIHPVPLPVPGHYAVEFTPASSEPYQMWVDVVDAKSNRHSLLPVALEGGRKSRRLATVELADQVAAGGVAMRFMPQAPLVCGRKTRVAVSLQDEAGQPVTDLEPVMGAYAHLVGFSADSKTLIHCHPTGEQPAHAQARGGPLLHFDIETNAKGPVQFYLQIKREGREVVIPFGQYIAPPAKAAHAEREMARSKLQFAGYKLQV
jgi:hypothetical protein